MIDPVDCQIYRFLLLQSAFEAGNHIYRLCNCVLNWVLYLTGILWCSFVSTCAQYEIDEDMEVDEYNADLDRVSYNLTPNGDIASPPTTRYVVCLAW